MFALILYPIEELGYIKHVLRNFESFKTRTKIEDTNLASFSVFKDIVQIHNNVIELVRLIKVFKIVTVQILVMWTRLITLWVL